LLNKFLVGTASDLAGEVIEVGPKVKNFKAGDKVVAMGNVLVRFWLYSFYLFSC
jgi:NADPH:quinone reductase-like Zn-dependent oxidoreductase